MNTSYAELIYFKHYTVRMIFVSNMVVRTNVFAINAHRNLKNTGLQQRKAAERLSSGFRINSAADDAAGLAISESMRAQIRGLDQASVNAQDAIGLIQTAEGAMSTISDMVIRVRELMVQAANDTNTYGNRETIQLEIDQIMQEINDVTFRTQFNTRTLLDGGLTGGGGRVSPVSLQWMLFQQARVVGLSHPDGRVGPNGTHPNPNNKNQTSLRSDVIELQTELNALARQVGDRLVRTGEMSSSDLQRMLNNQPPDFTPIISHMNSAETQQMRSLQNRLTNQLHQVLRTAEEIYQITQDQINALGGRNATNNNGTNIFIQQSLDEWNNAAVGARARLDYIRNALIGSGTLTAPNGVLGQLANVNDIGALSDFIVNLVGYSGGTVPIAGAALGLASATFMPSISSIAPMSAPTPPNATGDRVIDFNTLSGVQSGDGWTFSGGVLTITGDGDFQINGTGAATANRIVVAAGNTANIALNDVNIVTDTGAFRYAWSNR